MSNQAKKTISFKMVYFERLTNIVQRSSKDNISLLFSGGMSLQRLFASP
jgi:hypothetical protein